MTSAKRNNHDSMTVSVDGRNPKQPPGMYKTP